MATVAHSVLTTTELHEPKGVESASLGQVYVADGNGSGNWAGVGASSFTGMIADFVWPKVQDGWLELDGSDINISTYSALYDVMTIQETGTRVASTATITSLSTTANMKVNYYVFGVGIPSGTTIVSIDSGTQITLSNNVSSSGTSTVVVSPWLMNTGTIRLPDLKSLSRFRRTVSSSGYIGELQTTSNLAHTHSVTGNTGSNSASHSHYFSGNTGGESQSHTHSTPIASLGRISVTQKDAPVAVVNDWFSGNTGSNNVSHTHSFSGQTGVQTANHSHAVSLTSASSGTYESRPYAITVMTCVKT